MTGDFLCPVASRYGRVVEQAGRARESELGAIGHAVVVDGTIGVTAVKSNARTLKVVLLKIRGGHCLYLVDEVLLISLCFHSSNDARNLSTSDYNPHISIIFT